MQSGGSSGAVLSVPRVLLPTQPHSGQVNESPFLGASAVCNISRARHKASCALTALLLPLKQSMLPPWLAEQHAALGPSASKLTVSTQQTKASC